jgi:hypothetical protein
LQSYCKLAGDIYVGPVAVRREEHRLIRRASANQPTFPSGSDAGAKGSDPGLTP